MFILMVFKFVGIYPNFAALDNQNLMAVGSVGVGTDDKSHKWITDCLINLNRTFSHYVWRHNGPGLLER